MLQAAAVLLVCLAAGLACAESSVSSPRIRTLSLEERSSSWGSQSLYRDDEEHTTLEEVAKQVRCDERAGMGGMCSVFYWDLCITLKLYKRTSKCTVLFSVHKSSLVPSCLSSYRSPQSGKKENPLQRLLCLCRCTTYFTT